MTLHDDAVRVLSGWTAPDAQQESLRTAYLEHLSAHPDGLLRGLRARPSDGERDGARRGR